MNILDCVTYFDEELILELRLNILYDYMLINLLSLKVNMIIEATKEN